ncbi:MAG: mannose-1-phosphate guanylyltransferase [Candidatus Bipolaricaulia bacterium]
MSAFHAVILAGGGGTRFWPKSRRERPKQLLDILGDKPLIALTIDRLEGLVKRDQLWVVTHQDQVEGVRRHVDLDAERVLTEPASRNTAPAVGLAALHLQRVSGDDAVFAMLPADHYVADVDGFLKTLMIAKDVAAQGHLVTIGIRPRYPETGYGYIDVGEPLEEPDYPGVHRVSRFVEKPDRATAEAYVESGNFMWNGGLFIWRVGTLMAAFREHLPEVHEGLTEIERADFDPEAVRRVYEAFPDISIDYGIMESAENRAVVLGDFGWSDVGSWSALGELIDGDDRGNVTQGEVVALDTHDAVLVSERGLLATVGMRDVVVVATDDAVLVCPKERAQEVKAIVEALEASGQDAYL